jgi:hypothetical protein
MQVGVQVCIEDEGGWWPGRSDDALRQALDENNRAVAALAGAMKDELSDDSPGITAPILQHPEFERLEAEGAASKGASLDAAVNEIAKRRRPSPPT